MKTTKKDECSYSFSNAIRTLAMVTCGLRVMSPTSYQLLYPATLWSYEDLYWCRKPGSNRYDR